MLQILAVLIPSPYEALFPDFPLIMSEIKSEHIPSPGNDFSPAGLAVPPMRMPHLDFVYRIVCDMDPTVSEIRNAGGTGSTRLVLPILRGTVRGPRIKGEIVERSGADWAERIRPDKVWPTIDTPTM